MSPYAPSAALQSPLTIALVFAAYFAAVLAIGWVAYWRTRDLSDFILGGRTIGSGVAALSASASDMSGWLMLGLPGLAYATGLGSIWLALGLLLGTWLNWRLVARRLRVFSAAYGNALTLPEYFAKRFDDPRVPLRAIAAFFTLLFFLIYTGSGLVAGGKLFESVFGLPYQWAVGIGVLAVLLYTAFGGFLAVSWTDVLQGLMMAAALIAVPLVAMGQTGGPLATLEAIRAVNPNLMNPFTDPAGVPLGVVGILSLAAWGLGYFGQPHILARFQAIASPDQVGRARRIAITWVTLTLTGATLTGLAGIVALPDPLVGEARETVFIVLTNLLFHPLMAGLILAAILAAIMSTADSQLLVSSATFTEDFYRQVLRREASPRELVIAGRVSVVVIALIAYGLALDPGSLVLDLVGYAWAGFGAAFGPALVLSLYWPRMTGRAALAGILIGAATVVLWRQFDGALFELYEIVPGILCSILAILLINRADRSPRESLEQRFAQVSAGLRIG